MPLAPPGISAPDERQDSDSSLHSRSKSSGRVRFNSRVHVSPTPPNSDASSSDFRNFHSMGQENNQQLDGPQDCARGNEHRGRRPALKMDEGRWTMRDTRETGSGHDTQHLHAEASVSDSQTGQQTKAHAWVRGGRALKRALSESPSREDLIAESRGSVHDARGPYRPFENPTDSMEPQNDSHVGRTGSTTVDSCSSKGGGRDQWW